MDIKIAPLPPTLKPNLTDKMPPELHISYQVTVVANLMAFGNNTRNVKQFGLNIREWRVLAHIGQMGPQTARQIVDGALQDKATISRAIAELSRKELVAKLPNKLHKRSPFIWMTEKGKALYDNIVPVFTAQARQFTDLLSEEEKLQLCKILDKLKEHIEEFGEVQGLE